MRMPLAARSLRIWSAREKLRACLAWVRSSTRDWIWSSVRLLCATTSGAAWSRRPAPLAGRPRRAVPQLARFVFWGYQLFIVLAASGYLLGVTQSKEYAEPEWYVDWWLTIVWVAYLIVFVGTLARRAKM